MEALISLWLPILLSAAAVFIVSSILHMAFTYHNTDFTGVPNEQQVMNDLGKHNIPPGDYMVPHAGTNKERQSPEFQEKIKKGPIATITVFKPEHMNMGGSLVQWFIFCLVVSIFAAYVAGLTIKQGEQYMFVFRITSIVAFAGYGLALFQSSIWFKKKWSSTFKSVFDALIYALVTGGFFGWLWPAM